MIQTTLGFQKGDFDQSVFKIRWKKYYKKCSYNMSQEGEVAVQEKSWEYVRMWKNETWKNLMVQNSWIKQRYE